MTLPFFPAEFLVELAENFLVVTGILLQPRVDAVDRCLADAELPADGNIAGSGNEPLRNLDASREHHLLTRGEEAQEEAGILLLAHCLESMEELLL